MFRDMGSKSKSSSSDKLPQQPDQNAERVPNLPRLPSIPINPQDPRMGRVPEAAYCKACGTIAETKVTYVRGGYAIRWACIADLCAPWPVWFISCCLGIPKWSRENFWDVLHFCVNCGRKLGYNAPHEKCFCFNSKKAMEMPSD